MSVGVLDPNGLLDGLLPLPNMLPPLVFPPRDAKPPCLANPENAEGVAAALELGAALPNAL